MILVLSILISTLLFSHHDWHMFNMDLSSNGDLLTSTRSSTQALAPIQVGAYVGESIV